VGTMWNFTLVQLRIVVCEPNLTRVLGHFTDSTTVEIDILL